MKHPFADLIGMESDGERADVYRTRLEINPTHFNPNGVVHGGVLYALADTCMGGALFYSLDDGRSCATVEIKISYFKPVREGIVLCSARIIHLGNRLATLESELMNNDSLVAKAYGTFTIFSV